MQRAAPLVFHPVEGRRDCLACHALPRAGARPHKHPGITSSQSCRVCHTTAGGGLEATYGVMLPALLLMLVGLVAILQVVWRKRPPPPGEGAGP